MQVEQRVAGLGALDHVVEEAVGRGHRRDPVVAGTGGPAGNARLTAWVGLLLLVLIAAELVTLLDDFGLMDWHVGIGLAVTAFPLLKKTSTGWRIVRCYTGSSTYGSAGPRRCCCGCSARWWSPQPLGCSARESRSSRSARPAAGRRW